MMMAETWHTHAMPRIRVSTTVDTELLARARAHRQGIKDAELLDEALGLLVAQERRVETDRAIARGYEQHPFDEPDEWGSLAEWVDGVHDVKAVTEDGGA
jgi:hypothetical protein